MGGTYPYPQHGMLPPPGSRPYFLWCKEAVIQQIIVLQCKFKAQLGLTIFLQNCFYLFATLINFLSFSVEHLQAKAQKLEGRNFVPQGEFVLWQKVGPGAMVQEHVFQTPILGWDVYTIAILTFIRELIVVCGLAKANFW